MNISILGCGVFGLSLASVFSDNNNHVTMWSKFESEVLNLKGKYLNLNFTSDLDTATMEADLIVIAIPIAFLDDTMLSLRNVYRGQDIVIASKGIDTKNQLFAMDIVYRYLKEANVGVIAGGTFALDMQNKNVMGITLATKSDNIRNKIKSGFECNFIKVQYIDDMIGVSVCGALKNVMAIGFGMLDGANYPPSSKFLFLTEAIYEIKYLIKSLGGKDDTIMSYAGIDDIMMTCTSNDSRNYTLGNMLGKRVGEKEIYEYKNSNTIEGLGTCEAIYKLIKSKNISLPITETIYKVLYDNVDIEELIKIIVKKEF